MLLEQPIQGNDSIVLPETKVRSYAELRASLSNLPVNRRIVLEIPGLVDSERWEQRVQKYSLECGCKAGAIAAMCLLLGIGSFLGYDVAVSGRSLGSAAIFGNLAVVIAGSVAVKAVVLIHARKRLAQTVEGIARSVSPLQQRSPDLAERPHIRTSP